MSCRNRPVLRTLLHASVVVVLLGGGAVPAHAQGPDSIVIRGGGLIADFNSGVRLDVTGQTGTTVSFENDLGFTKNTGAWFIDGAWHIKGRQHLYASFVDTKRDSTKAGISQPITIAGTTFQVGATIQAFVDNNYLSLDYGLALTKNPKAEIVATIGLSSVKVHTGVGIAAQTTLGGGISRSLTTDAQDRSIFPVPGVQFESRLHPRVRITGYTRFIRATLGGVTQSSLDGRAGVEFPLASRVGFGATYYFNHVMEEGSKGTLNGKLTYTFHGPQFYGLVHF